MANQYVFNMETLRSSYEDYKNLESRVLEMFQIGKAKYDAEQSVTEPTFMSSNTTVKFKEWALINNNIVMYLEEVFSVQGEEQTVTVQESGGEGTPFYPLGPVNLYLPMAILTLELSPTLMDSIWAYIVASLKDKYYKKYKMVLKKLEILEKEKDSLLSLKQSLLDKMPPDLLQEIQNE